jgi:transcriptional regulator with XRE-family HTH domain
LAEPISAKQTRGARGMLDWSMSDLAGASQVSVSTIKRFEAGGEMAPSDRSVAKIHDALVNEGVRFLPDNGQGQGLRLKES